MSLLCDFKNVQEKSETTNKLLTIDKCDKHLVFITFILHLFLRFQDFRNKKLAPPQIRSPESWWEGRAHLYRHFK